MKKPAITYGKLDKVLRSLGFDSRLCGEDLQARVYDHRETGASFILPRLPDKTRVMEHHLVTVRVMLDEFGIANPMDLDAKLRKAG